MQKRIETKRQSIKEAPTLFVANDESHLSSVERAWSRLTEEVSAWTIWMKIPIIQRTTLHIWG
jgi:hypothetical protein